MLLSQSKNWLDVANGWLKTVGDFALRTLLPALILFVVGVMLIRVILRLLDKILERSRLEKTAHSLIRAVTRTVLYILLALTVASSLGIDVTGIVALASVLTLAISLSVQNALTNVISGFSLLYTKPFSCGDYVEVAGQSGTVNEIGLAYTKLATPDGKHVFIPNGAVTSAQIINYTVLGKRRLDVKISAAYTNAMQDVLDALKEAGDVPTSLPEHGIFTAVDSYGESAIVYVLRLWTTAEDYWPTMYNINLRIKRIFEEKGIAMTYPHLNVHLDK